MIDYYTLLLCYLLARRWTFYTLKTIMKMTMMDKLASTDIFMELA
jgi:hypothetical protein